MRIQEYACLQESDLIDTHERYVSSDRKKSVGSGKNTKKRKMAQLINLLLISTGRPGPIWL